MDWTRILRVLVVTLSISYTLTYGDTSNSTQTPADQGTAHGALHAGMVSQHGSGQANYTTQKDDSHTSNGGHQIDPTPDPLSSGGLGLGHSTTTDGHASGTGHVIPTAVPDGHSPAPGHEKTTDGHSSSDGHTPDPGMDHDDDMGHGVVYDDDSHHDNHSDNHTGNHTGHSDLRFHVAKFDFSHVQVPFIIAAWVVFAMVAKIFFHMQGKLSSIFPESCLLIIIGIVVGMILYFTEAGGYSLDSATFFLYLLPPIILEAGYFMPIRSFFENIGTILCFAVVGTLMNTFMIGFALLAFTSAGVGLIKIPLNALHCLVFSALISAVDPVAVLAVFEEVHVNENLHICVFGESLFNDAVTVVLYHMFETFSHIGENNITTMDMVAGVGSFFVVGLGGTSIGVLFGMIAAIITRFTNHVPIIEPLLIYVIGYLSYLSAEMFHLSGIMACTFCGIVMRKYAERNISKKSQTTVKFFMKMLASLCETIIFMFFGLSIVNKEHVWDSSFVFLTLIFCLVFRAIAVVLQCWVLNWRRSQKLKGVDQFIMAYGGLRGAIAFSLAALLNEDVFPEKGLLITTTVVVVLFTVFIQGTTIKPLVRVLRVKRANQFKPNMTEKINTRLIDHLMAGVEDIAGHFGYHDMRVKFQQVDNKYLKPVLLRKGAKKAQGMSILQVFDKLNERDATDFIKNHGSFLGKSNSMENMFSATSSMLKVMTAGMMGPGMRKPAAKANPALPGLLKPPAITSGSRSSSSNSLIHVTSDEDGSSKNLTINIPLDSGSSTVLDMHVVDHQETRKLKDDSKVHHIIDDAMFKPRKRFVRNERHMLHESEAHLFHHHVRQNLRHMISRSKGEHGHGHRHHHNHHHHHHHSKKKLDKEDKEAKKNVSFANVDEAEITVTKPKPEVDNTDNESEDQGITFTVSKETSGSPTNDCIINMDDYSPQTTITRTAAETTLPWKNFSNRNDPVSSFQSMFALANGDDPCPGEAPSWLSDTNQLTVLPISMLGQELKCNMSESAINEKVTVIHFRRHPRGSENNMSSAISAPQLHNTREDQPKPDILNCSHPNEELLRTKKIDDFHESAPSDLVGSVNDLRQSTQVISKGSPEDKLDFNGSVNDWSSHSHTSGTDDCYLPATWRTSSDNGTDSLDNGTADDHLTGGHSSGHFDPVFTNDILHAGDSGEDDLANLPPPWKNQSDSSEEGAQRSAVMFEIGEPSESISVRSLPWETHHYHHQEEEEEEEQRNPVKAASAADLRHRIAEDASMDEIDQSSMKCLSDHDVDDCIPPPWRSVNVSEGSVPVRSPSASHELDSLFPQASHNSLRLSEAESRHSEQFRGHHHVIDIAPRELEHTASSPALSAMVGGESDPIDLVSRVEMWLLSTKLDQQDPIPDDLYLEASSECEGELEFGDCEDTIL